MLQKKEILNSSQLASQLIQLLHQNNSTIHEIRQLLNKMTALSLIDIEFSLKALDKFIIAMRGNISIRRLQWTGGNPNAERSFEERKIEIYSILVNKWLNHQGELYQLKIHQALPDDEQSYQLITVDTPFSFDKQGFRNLVFTSSSSSAVTNFKLRVCVDPQQYLNEFDSILELIVTLNRKYAADPYNPPLQQVKAFLIQEQANPDLFRSKKIIELLLQSHEDDEVITKSLIDDIQDPLLKQRLVECRRATTEELEDELRSIHLIITARERLTNKAQITLYPLSHHPSTDIRLLFFIRDLEIEMKRRGILPTAAVAFTDSSIGSYVRFRQQLSESGEYQDFTSEQISQIKIAQELSPTFLFLKSRNSPSIYSELFQTSQGSVNQKISTVWAYYYRSVVSFDRSISSLELNLIEQFNQKIQQSSLTPEQLLQALDNLLLALQDRLEPISPTLLEISYFVEKVLSDTRVSMVAKLFTEIPKEDYTSNSSFFHPSLTAGAIKRNLLQILPTFSWKANAREQTAWVYFPDQPSRDKAKIIIQNKLKSLVPETRIEIADARSKKGNKSYAILLQYISLEELQNLASADKQQQVASVHCKN